jgi:GNAT superfamily N-acetyltransferase
MEKEFKDCEHVLRALPDWFGIEEAIRVFKRHPDPTDHPCNDEMMNGKNVGFLSVRRHTSVSAEIHVMGVLPEEHTKGIGPGMMRLVSLLAEAIESWCPCFIFPSI